MTPTKATYGKYQFVQAKDHSSLTRDSWAIAAGPAAMTKVKRVFGRVQGWRQGGVVVADTPEVARDLEWFIERYPLEPATPADAARLAAGAVKHRGMELAVFEVLAGTHTGSLLPREPARPPRAYQQQAVDLLRVTGGLLLTDEVGLGKTFTGMLSLAYEDALPAVVVAPTHLPPRWLDEVTESFPWLRTHVVKKMTPYELTGKDGVDPDLIVVPYSKLRGWGDHLAGHVRTVIFDEVQDLRKGAETQKGAAAGVLADAATYRLGLTATPIYNYAGELWNILNVLAPDALGTKDEFQQEWVARSWNGNMQVKDPAALGDYLRSLGVMLGRTRKEVGRELPETIKVVQTVESDPEVLEKAAGDAAEMARLILAQDSTRDQRFNASGQIDGIMRQGTGIAKAPYVAGFVRMLLESEDKVILFGWHRAVYDLWTDLLEDMSPVLYTGSESPTQKQESLEAFKKPTAEGGSRVLIMSLRSGAGTDGLQKVTSTAVFGELDWSPQVHEQAIGRVRRDGMGDAPPVAYFLNTEDGSDPAIMEVLQVKRHQNDAAVSKDGKLMNVGVADHSRARLLAEQAVKMLGSKRAAPDPIRPPAPTVTMTAAAPVYDFPTADDVVVMDEDLPTVEELVLEQDPVLEGALW